MMSKSNGVPRPHDINDHEIQACLDRTELECDKAKASGTLRKVPRRAKL